MSRTIIIGGISLAVVLGLGIRRAGAQAQLAEDIILLSKGQRERERALSEAHLGPVHGQVERPFAAIPGSGESKLGEPASIDRPAFRASTRNRDVLSAISGSRESAAGLAERPGIGTSARIPGQRSPFYGTLEITDLADEGPPGGITLDMAIERLVRANVDLATKFQELPKARADILTAGLRGNPLLFASADNVPYGNYSERRPGSNSYNITLIQPLDVNRKYLARVAVACRAKQVLEGLYQDAVRLEIGNLYTAFVDVLEARETVRASRVGLEGFDATIKATREQVEKGVLPEPELKSLLIQRDSAEAGLQGAEVSLRRATRVLAVLLAVPAAEAARLEVRGSIRVAAPPAPPVEELVGLALSGRPDLTATRVGVHSAQANVRLQEKERFPDIFVLYTPYGFENNAAEGRQSATSWSAGAMVSIPIRNRNQGNIARAKHTVVQTKIEVAGLEQRVVAEVEEAALDYGATLAVVQRLERSTLPQARSLRDDRYRLFTRGEEGITTYLNAQRDYNEVVRQYLDSLVRFRRAMLRLNTAVGQRVLP